MKSMRLRSVNWEHGMLLTPDHFLRQERYLESLFGWGLRFVLPGSGLVGGGIRLPESDLGALRNDPEVTLNESAESLDITITRARGLTPGGLIVDVEDVGALSARFAKDSLAGVAECVVYIVCDPDERLAAEGVPDAFNPQMRTERIPSYRIALDVNAAERAIAIAIARLRRPASGMFFEADAHYIPQCAVLSAHSELMAGSRRILDAVQRLANGYAELHRAMREFMVLFAERGIDTEVDRDSVSFVERMVLELQDTAYALLHRNQPPSEFFGRIRRMLHSAALYFDMAPGMQQYYDTLRETGESELASLIESQRHVLQMGRTLRLDDDLGLEVRRALQSLSSLERLEQALEGKYIDFRKSNSLESTNFIFDRGGKVLYRLSARPARVQGIVDEMTIFFSNLRLEGRDRYRLILVGGRESPFLRGTSIGADIRLNEGSGYRRESIILTSEVKLDEQNNIELDFEAPDVPTITDLRLTVPAYHGVRTALLFMRHRFYIGTSATPERLSIEPAPVEKMPAAATVVNRGGGEGEIPRAVNGNGAHSSAETALPPQQPPWMPRDSAAGRSTDGGSDLPPRPRRRRLE